MEVEINIGGSGQCSVIVLRMSPGYNHIGISNTDSRIGGWGEMFPHSHSLWQDGGKKLCIYEFTTSTCRLSHLAFERLPTRIFCCRRPCQACVSRSRWGRMALLELHLLWLRRREEQHLSYDLALIHTAKATSSPSPLLNITSTSQPLAIEFCVIVSDRNVDTLIN